MKTDVLIVGGGMIGSSIAWWLTHLGFNGRITIAERDPSYEFASTSHTNSCVRQQFRSAINIRISQFCVEFIKTFQDVMGGSAPSLTLNEFGYLYLAETEAAATTLRDAQQLQASLGVATRLLNPAQIADDYPIYNLDGILLGSHNPHNEGYFDGGTMFDWFRKQARAAGVRTLNDEVVALARSGRTITSATLRSGQVVHCGTIINAAGPRAGLLAQMAGLAVPVEPRKRFTFIFDAADPLPVTLPLTIDPSGVHMRSDGRYFMAGSPPDDDGPVAPGDFAMPPEIWQEKVWPTIAHRVPAFERVKVLREWVGHYAYNSFDQNALLGPHPEIDNLLFANGFSGHGLQQAPAIGRGLAEWVLHGAWRSLDLSPLSVERIISNTPLRESAVI